jgi:hypothetical protein
MLHPKILQILEVIINKYMPEYTPISEIQGLAGGRNDLIGFKYNSRKVLFEIFATPSQVSRDLRLLDKTQADIKIAIIIDKEVDKKVIEKFLRENPENNYPFIFISQFLDKNNLADTILKLRNLIYKDDSEKILEAIRKKVSYTYFIKKCTDENIKILISPFSDNDITFKNIFITLIVNKIFAIIRDNEKVLKLVKWLSDDKLIEFLFMKIDLGFNVFIFSDLKETYCIESDVEFLDWLRIFDQEDNPFFILPLNKIFYDIDEKIFKNTLNINKNIRFTVGQSQLFEEEDGNIVTFSVPNNTKKIILFRPMIFDDSKKDLFDWEKYKNMIEYN